MISTVWVCSRIGGLTRSLQQILPQLSFLPVTEDRLKDIETQLIGEKDVGNQRPQALIVDNSIIPNMIPEIKIPFKFIQVKSNIVEAFSNIVALF